MRNTRAALYFIVEILQREQIPFEVDGGFAAYLYGTGRPLADIDINVSKEHFHRIVPFVREYLTFGPARYEDKQWRLTLMSFKYAGQQVDISALGEIEYFDSLSKSWKQFPEDMEGQRIIRYEDLDLPVINEVKLMIYKEQLHRGVDLKDIAGMIKSLFKTN